MRNLIVLMSLALLVSISSCSNSVTSFNTSTPEEFGKTLIEVCRAKDSVAYSSLMATQEDMLKFIEESKEYKELKSNGQLFAKAMLESTFESNNRHLKKSFQYVLQDFNQKGLDLNKIKIIKVESKDISKNNVFWINTTFEFDGKQYIMRCENVLIIPGKGFRMNKEYPNIYKIQSNNTPTSL